MEFICVRCSVREVITIIHFRTALVPAKFIIVQDDLTNRRIQRCVRSLGRCNTIQSQGLLAFSHKVVSITGISIILVRPFQPRGAPYFTHCSFSIKEHTTIAPVERHFFQIVNEAIGRREVKDGRQDPPTITKHLHTIDVGKSHFFQLCG